MCSLSHKIKTEFSPCLSNVASRYLSPVTRFTPARTDPKQNPACAIAFASPVEYPRHRARRTKSPRWDSVPNSSANYRSSKVGFTLRSSRFSARDDARPSECAGAASGAASGRASREHAQSHSLWNARSPVLPLPPSPPHPSHPNGPTPL